MNLSPLTTFALGAVVVAGCSPRPATNNYGTAAVGLGAVVAGTAVYRAVTGGCVAACTPGHICDRRSGLCVATECSPMCPEGEHCVRDFDDRLRCEDDGLTSSLMAARKRAPAADAGAIDARTVPSGAADASTPDPTPED